MAIVGKSDLIPRRKSALHSWNLWSAAGFIGLGIAQAFGLVHLDALLVDPGTVALVTISIGAWQGTLRLKTRRPVLPDDWARGLRDLFPWAFGTVATFTLFAWWLLR